DGGLGYDTCLRKEFTFVILGVYGSFSAPKYFMTTMKEHHKQLNRPFNMGVRRGSQKKVSATN
ncbi:MAG: hypothetical protein WA364_19270, partial [Candidatus Nitrosopolaris sp.]